MDIPEFCSHYPRLFHMAQSGSWESIKKYGLLSTTAILDLFKISGGLRIKIEARSRPESVTLSHPEHGSVTIRDNKPLPESKLSACLTDMTPEEWYRSLNAKVFFWPTRERVLGLLHAHAYRQNPHTIITVDTRSLIAAHRATIRLSRINSGAAIFQPTPRGSHTFVSLADWPADVGARSGRLKSPVGELAVGYSVPDIAHHATQVEEMRAGGICRLIWSREG